MKKRRKVKKTLKQNVESAYYLSFDEINKMLSCCKEIKKSKDYKERVIIKILSRSGLRREELVKLKVKDIDFERKRFHIIKGKGGKLRTVPTDDDTLNDIKLYLDNRNYGYLIHSERNGFSGLTTRQINRAVGKIGKKGKIKNPKPKKEIINPHILRHSFGRLCVLNGMPLPVLQKIMGHEDIRTTIKYYGTPSIDDMQKSYDNIIHKVNFGSEEEEKTYTKEEDEIFNQRVEKFLRKIEGRLAEK